MLKTLWNAASSINKAQMYLDAAAHNIANVNTDYYKNGQLKFAGLLYNSTSTAAVGGTPRQIYANEVRIYEVQKSFTRGNMVETGRELDLAIDGPGFIQVTSPSGEELYTRGSILKVDEDNYLVDTAGNRIYPGLQLPEGYRELKIARNGLVTVTDNEGEKVDIGEIGLYRFANPAGLTQVENNLYAPGETSGIPRETIPGEEGCGLLWQGFVESSNVDLIMEMAKMMEAQRAYQINTRSIKAGDEMWQMANNLRGR